MAVDFEKQRAPRRIRFTSDVSHDGKDYGPQYAEQECEVDSITAGQYVREGRAEYVDEKADIGDGGLTTQSAGAVVAGAAGKAPKAGK